MPDPVDAAFAAVPRADFLPPSVRDSWRLDRPLPLAHGQTNSQPSTVAAMLRLLDVQPGMKVLDVGAGSGWTTALLAELVGSTGEVHGVERHPDLVHDAGARLAAGPWRWARVEQATRGVLGAPERGPFDRILVSAEAGALPAALVDQLLIGGVMVIPVAGTMTRVVRDPEGARITTHGAYVFVPLVED